MKRARRLVSSGHKWDGSWMHTECYVPQDVLDKMIIRGVVAEGLLSPRDPVPVPEWFDRGAATAEDWERLAQHDAEWSESHPEEERAHRIETRQSINRKLRRALQDKQLREFVMAAIDVIDAITCKDRSLHFSQVGEGGGS